MKRILIYLLVLTFGIVIGYALNNLLRVPRKHPQPKKIFVDKIKKQIIKDTIIVEKFINTVPSGLEEDTTDTTSDSEPIDSTFSNENHKDDGSDAEVNDTNEVIISEKMIGHRLTYLKHNPIDSTDIEAMLGVESNAFSNEITIEFWQSPLNLTGYVLTRNKLKLFGFNPNETFTLHLSKDSEHLFLNTETLSILLEKTEQFKNLALK